MTGTITLDAWVSWAFRPHRSWHPFPSTALARQAARDTGTPVSHDEFNTAMKGAGFQIVRRSGSVVFWGVRDTAEKKEYFRRRYLAADDSVEHPLLKATEPSSMPIPRTQ
jgi:hypothetical protein